jgi:hypothetical protein
MTVATPEFNDGEDFMLWLEALEDYEPLLNDDKPPLSGSNNS